MEDSDIQSFSKSTCKHCGEIFYLETSDYPTFLPWAQPGKEISCISCSLDGREENIIIPSMPYDFHRKLCEKSERNKVFYVLQEKIERMVKITCKPLEKKIEELIMETKDLNDSIVNLELQLKNISTFTGQTF